VAVGTEVGAKVGKGLGRVVGVSVKAGIGVGDGAEGGTGVRDVLGGTVGDAPKAGAGVGGGLGGTVGDVSGVADATAGESLSDGLVQANRRQGNRAARINVLTGRVGLVMRQTPCSVPRKGAFRCRAG
jgi:hypothetical protein